MRIRPKPQARKPTTRERCVNALVTEMLILWRNKTGKAPTAHIREGFKKAAFDLYSECTQEQFAKWAKCTDTELRAESREIWVTMFENMFAELGWFQ